MITKGMRNQEEDGDDTMEEKKEEMVVQPKMGSVYLVKVVGAAMRSAAGRTFTFPPTFTVDDVKRKIAQVNRKYVKTGRFRLYLCKQNGAWRHVPFTKSLVSIFGNRAGGTLMGLLSPQGIQEGPA